MEFQNRQAQVVGYGRAATFARPELAGTCVRFQRRLPLIAVAVLALLLAVGASLTYAADPADSKPLQIYFVDVEGGQSTLFVTPDGHSLLIDAGWPGNDFRDADRIAAAAHDAGIQKIDYVIITHYHDDHVGGVPQLVQRIPVGTFIDHGANSEPEGNFSKNVYGAYQQVLATGKYQRITPKPGDKLPIPGLNVLVISADGAVLQAPLPGAGQPNPYCASTPVPPADKTENPRSLGTLITFGQTRILDLGDLTAEKERDLMCPNNRLGKIDIFIASHHGTESSDSAVLVHAISPRVAIVDNGAKKGGSPSVLDTIKSSPGLAGMWQLHYSDESGDSHNAPAQYIANPKGTETGAYLKLTVKPDRSFTVYNSRTKESKELAVATPSRE